MLNPKKSYKVKKSRNGSKTADLNDLNIQTNNTNIFFSVFFLANKLKKLKSHRSLESVWLFMDQMCVRLCVCDTVYILH